MLGTATLAPELTHVSKHGFWLLLDSNEELLVSFSDFPWFRTATLEQLFNVERPSSEHLYWPDLDIDISIASIREPENFPLVSKVY